jgi:hypothetical protein
MYLRTPAAIAFLRRAGKLERPSPFEESSMRALCIGLVAVFVCAGGVRADDEVYDLRGPAPKKGLGIVSNSKFSMKNAAVAIELGGLKLEGKMDMTSTTDKDEEILGVDGREVTKLRTKIIKDEVKRKTEINGMTENVTEKKELAGEIVLSEKTKDGWKHVLEDTKPTEKQEKALKDFDNPENEDDLYPAEKVKVGATWDIKAEAFKKVLGSKATDVKGKGKSKLLRIEEFDGEKCAVIETDLDLKATMKEEGNDIKVEMKGKAVSVRSLKDGLDRKYSIEGSASFAGKIKEDGQEADIKFSGKMSGDGTAKLKSK